MEDYQHNKLTVWDKWGPPLVVVVFGILLYAADARWGEDEARDSFAATWSSDSGTSERVVGQIQKLYDWHNVFDPDRVPLWYVPRSLVTATRELTKAIEAQTHMLDRQAASFDRLSDEVRDNTR